MKVSQSLQDDLNKALADVELAEAELAKAESNVAFVESAIYKLSPFQVGDSVNYSGDEYIVYLIEWEKCQGWSYLLSRSGAERTMPEVAISPGTLSGLDDLELVSKAVLSPA